MSVAERDVLFVPQPFRRFVIPAIWSTLAALVATLISIVRRRRTRQPRLPRMSDAWLRGLDVMSARNDSLRGY